MASYRSREGKALAPTSQLCSSCERETAHRYCPECTSALCQHCERGHKKNKYTKDHNIINLGELMVSRTGTQLKDAVKCKQHSRDVKQICADCLVLLCAKCESEHRGHNITGISNDSTMLQNVCTEEVRRLLDLGVDLQKDKRVCEELIQKYEETNRMIQQTGASLIQSIKDSLKEFERNTQQSKNRIQGHLQDKNTGVAILIKQSDDQVKKLTDLRRQGNIGVLLEGIGESLDLNGEGKLRHEMIVADDKRKAITEFVAKTREHKFNDDLKQYFRFPFSKTMPNSLDKLNMTTRSKSLHLKHTVSLPNFKGKYGWRFCHTLMGTDRVIMYERGGKDILDIDQENMSYTRYIPTIEVFKLTCIHPDQYVAVDDLQHNHLYLLNKTFHVTTTSKFKDDDCYTLDNLSPISDKKFIVTEVNDEEESAKFTFVEVKNGKFIKSRTGKTDIYATLNTFLDEDGKSLTVIDEDDIFHHINLNNFASTRYNMIPYGEGLSYGCVLDYGGNFIIGYETGDIRVFKENMLDKTILKTGLKLKNLKVAGNRLYVCDENNLYVYE